MSLPYTDPSLPSNPSPVFGDVDAARGDHLRANNNAIWGNLSNLDGRVARKEILTPTASGGTLTLTSESAKQQQITGASTETVVLPVVSTLFLGFDFKIINSSSANVTVNSSGGNLVKTVLPGKSVVVSCIAITGTTATSWAIVDASVNAEQLGGAALSTDGTFSENSDIKIPSEKAVETRVQALTQKPTTAAKTASYAMTDTDGLRVVEYDTTSGDCTHTMPLGANNVDRRIVVRYAVVGSTNKVIIVPHASNSNTITSDGMAAVWLTKKGDYAEFQWSATSGKWELLNKRISAQMRLHTAAGFGGTDTKIIRFSTAIESYGNMFSENHSSGYSSNTKGLEITINKSGIYSIVFEYGAASGIGAGLTLNLSTLTTEFAACAVASKLSQINVTPTGMASYGTATFVGYLTAGDVVRTHGSGYMDTNYGTAAVCVSFIG